jgi:hypothetical protein
MKKQGSVSPRAASPPPGGPHTHTKGDTPRRVRHHAGIADELFETMMQMNVIGKPDDMQFLKRIAKWCKDKGIRFTHKLVHAALLRAYPFMDKQRAFDLATYASADALGDNLLVQQCSSEDDAIGDKDVTDTAGTSAVQVCTAALFFTAGKVCTKVFAKLFLHACRMSLLHPAVTPFTPTLQGAPSLLPRTWVGSSSLMTRT